MTFAKTTWSRCTLAAALLVSAAFTAAGADETSAGPMRQGAENGAFISDCAFPNGVKAVLVYPLTGEEFFVILRDGRDTNDLSTVRMKSGGGLTIETNGGIGKQLGIDQIFHVLLSRPFTFHDAAAFSRSLEARSRRSCSFKYPF